MTLTIRAVTIIIALFLIVAIFEVIGFGLENRALRVSAQSTTAQLDSVKRTSARANEYGVSPAMITLVEGAARTHQIDVALLLELIELESGFNSAAVSKVGAVGLLQVMPRTADIIEPGSSKRLTDPVTNLRVGAAHLQHLLARYSNERLALLAYNMGEKFVDAKLAVTDPLRGYRRIVLPGYVRHLAPQR